MASKRSMIPQSLSSAKVAKSDDCFDLPIINDDTTREYASFAKIMIIFQGTCLMNSLILKLQSMFESKAFVINDHPNENTSGSYSDKLKQQAKKAVDENVQLIVVNSSFSDLSLNRYYFALAYYSHYLTLVIPPFVLPSGDLCISNTYLPLFSAWNLDDFDSNLIITYARLTIRSVFSTCTAFKYAMTMKSLYPSTLCGSYNLIPFLKMRSCIAKVFRDKDDIKEYFEKSAVKNSYGKFSVLEITAIVVTPYSVYAKVKLNSQQEELFDLANKSSDMTYYPSTLIKQSLKSLPNITMGRSRFLCCSTLKIQTRTNDTRMVVFPESGRFSHAHIELGYNEKSPVNKRNTAAALGTELEKTDPNSQNFQLFEFEKYYVKRIEDYWYIYPKNLVTVGALFTTFCKLV